jgi:hypothetical protein
MLSELTQAVIAQLNLDDDPEYADSIMRDIVNNYLGAAGGFHGFTYYTETTAFYDAHEAAIWDALYNDAANLGQTPMQMIASFATADQITDALTFKNALAWYALERAAIEWEWAADDAAIA